MEILGRELSSHFEAFLREQRTLLGFDIEFHDIRRHPAQDRIQGEGASDRLDDRMRVWLDPSLEPEYFEALAAHEIMEIVLQEVEGFPHGKGPPDLDIGAKMISYVLDPLVDARIREHGFEPEPRWRKGVELLKKELSADGFECPAWSDLKAREIALRYMHSGLLSDEIAQAVHELVEATCPEIAAMGRTLLDLVRRHGYETRDEACTTLTRIRGVLGLQDLVLVWSQSEGRYV